MRKGQRRSIEVWADWAGLKAPAPMGVLNAASSGGKEVFSFEYSPLWLQSDSAQSLDPGLQLFEGPQYLAGEKPNFGLFLDSSPDRWGRMLMKRREAQLSRIEGRPQRPLYESDYLLGVYDGHRMGALRFKGEPGGPFLDDNDEFAAPPWTSLRTLEYASLQIEREGARDDPEYGRWLQLLLAPGSSIGGARPKAGVVDEKGALWIAKFPSRSDEYDLGAWEYLVHQLANGAGIRVAPAAMRQFNTPHHTFLTQRFDRTAQGERIHFASAMTLLGRSDGDDFNSGASYLEMAGLLMQSGAQPQADLEQLWRRIVFSICVSNVDDHLRNHGFLLQPGGWVLSPAYDLNPVPYGDGLKLNVSENDNQQDLDLAREVAPLFRLKPAQAEGIIGEVVRAVQGWLALAGEMGISRAQQEEMANAFRVAEAAPH
jgi:serine/threonine-protein kinase HipA